MQARTLFSVPLFSDWVQFLLLARLNWWNKLKLCWLCFYRQHVLACFIHAQCASTINWCFCIVNLCYVVLSSLLFNLFCVAMAEAPQKHSVASGNPTDLNFFPNHELFIGLSQYSNKKILKCYYFLIATFLIKLKKFTKWLAIMVCKHAGGNLLSKILQTVWLRASPVRPISQSQWLAVYHLPLFNPSSIIGRIARRDIFEISPAHCWWRSTACHSGLQWSLPPCRQVDSKHPGDHADNGMNNEVGNYRQRIINSTQ